MTTSQTPNQIPVRLDIDKVAPGLIKAVSHLQQVSIRELDQAGIEARLRELIRIHASQVNGCGYCIDMHTKDARAVGETEQRIYALPAWRETPYFTARERAALALTEEVTRLAERHMPDHVYEAAAAEFTDTEIAALLSAIVVINAWNMIGVTTHAWEAGSYQP